MAKRVAHKSAEGFDLLGNMAPETSNVATQEEAMIEDLLTRFRAALARKIDGLFPKKKQGGITAVSSIVNEALAQEAMQEKLMQAMQANPRLMEALQRQRRFLDIQRTGLAPSDRIVGMGGPFQDPDGLASMMGL